MEAKKLGAGLPTLAAAAALAVAAAGAALPGAARAADKAAGKTLAEEVCRTCHGLDGISKQPNVPHLAGQPSQYLEEQLTAYRSGARQNEQMSIIAEGLTDEQIADVAAWYSEIKINATAPQ